MDAEFLKKQFQLEPHPEGGWYKETYRSEKTLQNENNETRNVSTIIYFLLEDQDKSHFHRIKSDETWFFHGGEAVDILLVENNELKILKLGNDLMTGEFPQHTVPANVWFAACIHSRSGYSFVSCAVAPGFDFHDFQLAGKNDIVVDKKWHDIVTEFIN